MEGYFKVHRKTLDSQVFAHQTALKIWIWCLAKASYKERFISLKIGRGETTVKVNPGEFLFGRFKAEEELNIDGSTIYKWINKFASPEFDMISIKSNKQYTVISINKWDEYQNESEEEVTTKEQPSSQQVATKEQPSSQQVATKEQPSSQQVATKEQPSNTNNKDNTVYKVISYNKFYDSEIQNSNSDENYLRFVKILFGNNNLGIPLTSVLKMDQQVTYPQFKKLWYLREKYKFSITDVLERMENWKKINGNKTVYKTFLTFVKRDNPSIVI